MDETTNPPKKSHPKRPSRPIIILLILCIAALGTSFFFYQKWRTASQTTSVTQTKLAESLAKIIELPDEQPTVVTVSDKQKLTNQALAERVENKDMLLIYGRAQKLIVYRPSSQKVIDIITFGEKNTPGTLAP